MSISNPSVSSWLPSVSSVLLLVLSAAGCAEPTTAHDPRPPITVTPPPGWVIAADGQLVPAPAPPAGSSSAAPVASTSATVAPEPVLPALAKPRGLARGDGSAPDALLVLGDTLFDKGDFAEAEAAYRKAMTSAPKDPAAIVGFARARLAKEKVPVDFNSAPTNATLKGMVQELKRAVKLDAAYAPAQLELGRALLVFGKADEAMAALARAVELDPSEPEAHSAFGVSLLARGDIPGAAVALKKAADLDPRSAPRQSNLGTALLASGKVAEAIVAYERALKIAPNDPGTLSDLGTALLAQNQPDDAIKHLSKAGQLAPKNAAFRQNLAYAHHLKGEFDKAKTLYEEALKLDDKLISAWINLGNLHAQRGRVDEARAAYEKAKAVDPTDPRVKTALSELDELTKSKKP